MIDTYAELHPLVVPRLRGGVPPGVLALEIQQAARRFCKESWTWRSELTAIDVVADQREYSLAYVAAVVGPPAVAASGIPDKSDIVAIDWVKVDDALWPVSHYELYQGATLRFAEDYAPTEASTDGLEVKVVLAPRLEDDAMPGWLLNQWHAAVANAAIAAISAAPNKPYFDELTAARHEQMYQDDLSRAKWSNETGHVRGDVFVKPNEWL